MKNDPVPHQKIELFFQAKRLIQIFWALEFTFALIFIQRVALKSYTLGLAVIATMLVLSSVYFLAKKNRVKQASSILLFTVTSILIIMMWLHSGIHDEVVFGIPSLLIMAAMFGNKKSFIVLLIIFTLSIALNSLANHLGWIVNHPPSVDMTSAVLLLLMLFLISYSIWVAAMDYRILLDKLHKENSEVLNSKKEIEALLLHDVLTGLPNRAMAEIVVNNVLNNAKRENRKVYLMFIDLDNFKLINDALGHQAGDALLIKISSSLKNILRPSDTVCRFAGDEFIIIFDSIESQELMASISEKIIDTIKIPFNYNSNEFICGCSIGITVAPDDGNDFDTLLRNADTAMYFSKSNGGNSFHYFDTNMDTHGHDYLNLINELRVAIKQEQFFLEYQPKINLATNEIIGAEALIRWRHPSKGIIYPDKFISEAEKSGLIIEIGDWVIQQACITCRSWVTLGYDSFTIAVNVSSQQFKRGDITQTVKSSLQQANLLGKHLEIEMTESLLIENSENLKGVFKDIQSLGVKFSVDDFGTGYSNLRYLKEFEVKALKVDRSFVLDIETNAKNKILVKAIIQMAKGLELTTVVEGIESIQVKEILESFECEYAQGYLWSKPISNEKFIEYVNSYQIHHD